MTEGSVFAATKLTLRTCMLSINLLLRARTPLYLTKNTGFSATSALEIKHRLSQVRKDQHDQVFLRSLLLVDGAY